jgi:hypothetical protein
MRYLDGFDDHEKQSLGGLLKMLFVNGWGQPGTPLDDRAESPAPPSAVPPP